MAIEARDGCGRARRLGGRGGSWPRREEHPAGARLAAAFVLGLVLVPTWADGAGSAGPENVRLVLHETFEMANATLLLGRLEWGPRDLRDPLLVGAERLAVPAGDIVACPVQRGTRGILPALQALDGRCRGGVTHPDAQVTFGPRTWLQFAGNYTLEAPGNASLATLLPGATGTGTRWAAVLSGPLTVSFRADTLRFLPILPSSQVILESRGERTHYNGTGTAFLYGAAGKGGLFAAGAAATLPAELAVRLTPADPLRLAPAIDARTLLDLQESLEGPERREALRNATVLFEHQGRVPHFLRGAFLGRLNGTVEALSLRPEVVTLVRVDAFEGALREKELAGSAKVLFVNSPGGFGPRGGTPVGPPWALATALWVLAVLAMALGLPAPKPARQGTALEPALFSLAFLVWDARFAGLLGTSGLRLLDEEVPAGSVLAILVFEALALLLAWLLLYAPVRTIARRLLPGRWSALGGPLAFLVFTLYVLLRPAALLALGGVVARL